MVTILAPVELGKALIACRKERDWAAAYALLEPILQDETHLLRGCALMELAITEWAQSPRLVLNALRHIDQALAMLVDPADIARSLVAGCNCAKYADDRERYQRYANRARVLIDQGDPGVLPWSAHLLIWIGYFFRDTGRPEAAEPCFVQAISAVHKYGTPYRGTPYEERDANCQLRIAFTALGEVQVQQGRHLEAAANLRRSIDIDSPNTRGDVEYLHGLLAYTAGNYSKAVDDFDAAVRIGVGHRDHAFVVKASEMLVQSLSAAGKRSEITVRLQPIIRDAAYAELDHVVNRLQRLTKTLTSGEGAIS